MTDTCRVCDAKLPEGVRFCPACGAARAEEADALGLGESDPFSTAFEAHGDEAALSALREPGRGGLVLLVVAVLVLGAGGGYLAHGLLGSEAAPQPPEGEATQPETPDSVADPSATEPDAASPVGEATGMAVDAGSLRVGLATLAARLKLRSAEPPPVAAVPGRANSTLVRELATTVVAHALDGTQAFHDARSSVAAAREAARRRSSSRPVPESAFAGVRVSRAAGQAASALAAGEVADAQAALTAARAALDDGETTLGELPERIERAAELLATVETELAATRCREARTALTELSELAPPLRQRFRRPLEECVERDERRRGLPPRTLE